MSEFQQWVSTRPGEDYAFCFDVPPTIEPLMDALREARRPEGLSQRLQVRVPPEFVGRLADDFTVLGEHCLFLSKRLVELLRSHGVDSFETHPCRIVAGSAPEQNAEYSFIIIRDLIYCLDWDNSDLVVDREDPKFIETVRRLAIDESRLGGNLLFRLGEDPWTVIVHKSVAQAIEQSGVTGVAFVPVDGSIPLPRPEYQSGGEWPDSVVDYITRTEAADENESGP